jgi:hypothetical protein
VAVLVGCQQQSEPPSPPLAPETLVYTNSEHGFSLEYPKDWNVEEGSAGTVVLFTGPQVGEYEYMVNINIVTEELPSEMTVQDYARMAELQQKKAWSDYVKVKEYTSTISGLPAVVKTFTATPINVPLKDIQVFFIKDEVAYIITYDVAIDSHDEYAEFFDLAISTFKFE